MKKFLTIALALVSIAAAGLRAQTLELVRTDVDSTRSDFITATFLFGFDVVAKDVANCNTVAFELHYNYADAIKLSKYEINEFGDDGTTTLAFKLDKNTNEGVMHIGVISKKPRTASGDTVLNVIHLEFAVSVSAPDGDRVTFSFQKANATVFQDTNRAIIPFAADPVVYDIHGFVNVWPGDADDDGDVDVTDVNLVGNYVDSLAKYMRSFKRQNASALWTPQRVLVWDVAEATYADCDGNGVVTGRDQLVVNLRLADSVDYTHSAVETAGGPQPVIIPAAGDAFPQDAVFIPIKAKFVRPYIAASCELFWNEAANIEILGARKGDVFPDDKSHLYFRLMPDKNKALLNFGVLDKNFEARASGTLAYIVARTSNPENAAREIWLGEISAVSKEGEFFILDAAADVPAENFYSRADDMFAVRGERLQINPSPRLLGDGGVKIYDVFGRLTLSRNVAFNGSPVEINLEDLASGAYIIIVSSGDFVASSPAIIDK